MAESYNHKPISLGASFREPKRTIKPTDAIQSLKDNNQGSFIRGLVQGLRPLIQSLGAQDLQLGGVRINIPEDKYRILRIKGQIVDFSDTSFAGLNGETLVAIAASLQGAGEIAREAVDYSHVPHSLRPIAFVPSYAATLQGWIDTASTQAKKAKWERKKGFYRGLQLLLHEAFRYERNDPTALFDYCLNQNQHLRGSGVFSAFFPEFSKLLKMSVKKRILENIRSEPLQTALKKVSRGRERRIEMPKLVEAMIQTWQAEYGVRQINFTDITDFVLSIAEAAHYEVKNKANLAVEKLFLTSDREINIEDIAEERTLGLDEAKPKGEEEQNSRDTARTEKLVQDLGLGINRRETQMLRENYHLHDAIVISPDVIRANPDLFFRLQRQILQEVADILRVKYKVDINEPLPIPAMPNGTTAGEIEAFRKHESYLRNHNSSYLVLLHPIGQKLFFELMPFTRVPPYVVIDGDAVPVSNVDRKQNIQETVARGGRVVNHLPFLHFVQNTSEGLSQLLTIPGSLFSDIIKNQGTIFVDHGTIRWVLGKWGEFFYVNQDGYVASNSEQKKHYPALDIDTLILGTFKIPLGSLVDEYVKKINMVLGPKGGGGLISSSMLASSMGEEREYHFISKDPPRGISKKNPYEIAHAVSNIVQLFRAWSGGKNSRGQTNQLIETLMTLSTFRSMGMVPFLLSSKPNIEEFAVKAIDFFGGLLGYREGGGGVMVNGEKRNAIRFIDIDEAFPRMQSSSIWHLLRTLTDIIYTENGGVLMPAGITKTYSSDKNYWEDAQQGAREIRNRVYGLSDDKKKIIKNLGSKSDDLRSEMIRIRKLINDAPLKMLVLFSGDELEDRTLFGPEWKNKLEELGLLGIELSRLYPNMHALRKNRAVWRHILNGVKNGKREDGETGEHFLARVILEVPLAKVIISDRLKSEFFADPLRVGSKFYKPSLPDETPIPEAWDFMILDPDGLGVWAAAGNRWEKFIKYVNKNNIQLQSVDDIENIVVEHPHLFSLAGSPQQRRVEIRAEIEEKKAQLIAESQENRERMIHAIIHWLVYPGFDAELS